MRLRKLVGWIAAALIAVVGLGLTFAPVIVAELWPVQFRLHLPMTMSTLYLFGNH